ncbi:MAG: hypothetical protein NC299_16920 [Lachnospiraceae bacterium]|nr:hypothetical protein [Ruminococcus sp.]MCM1277014.1 hypothetical protein [Lachnospiraceae bacterium]
MKLKPVTMALALGMALMTTSCVYRTEKTVDIFNLDSPRDMAVTIYYDVEEPSVEFITPGGTKIPADSLPTDRDNGAVCWHILNAAVGQWRMNYDKKNNTELDVNWTPDIQMGVFV